MRAIFRARQGCGGHGLDGCHPVGQRPTHGRMLKPAPVTAKLQAGGPSRITSAGSAATGFVGGSASPLSAQGGGPETRGQRGRSPPPAPPGDTRSVATEGKLACLLVSHNHADPCLICTTGSRGRPGLLSSRRGERSEPRRSSVGGGMAASDGGPSMYPEAGAAIEFRQCPYRSTRASLRPWDGSTLLRFCSGVSPRWNRAAFHASVTRGAMSYGVGPQLVSSYVSSFRGGGRALKGAVNRHRGTSPMAR